MKLASALCLLLPVVAHASDDDWRLEAGIGTDLVEQGVSLTRGGPGFIVRAEYGGDAGFFAGVEAHNIDAVPNGALDRNLFVRVAPQVGWRWAFADDVRIGAALRYVVLPEAIPDTDYLVLALDADWRDRMHASIDHSPDRFGLGEATTAYEAGGLWSFRRGFAVRGLVGFHDFDAVGGDDYAYAGVGLVASTPKFDVELAYHVLDSDGDTLFAPLEGQPGFVLTVTGRSGDTPSWAADTDTFLDRVSLSAELRSQYISSGISQTFDAPAVQVALNYETPGGTFFEVWGSNVDYVPDGEEIVGADSEIDYTLGHRFTLSEDWELSARASLYTYPGAEDRSEEWDETEFVFEGFWRDRLRLKAGLTPKAAGVNEMRAGYTARWKQPVFERFTGAFELGYKDKRDWGQSYTWCMAEVARPVGPVTARLRYWYVEDRGRRANGTADPTFEFAFAWNL